MPTHRRNNRPSKARRMPRRSIKRRPRRRATGVNSPWSAVAHGAKTLISLIPGIGSTLSSLADMAFKSLGVVTEGTAGTWTDQVTSIVGLGGEFMVPLSIFASNAPELANSNDHGVGNDRTFLSRYATARMAHLAIKLLPGSQMQTRQGEWALSFTPFYSSDDETAYKSPAAIPTFNNVASRPGAKFGSATKSLQINFRNSTSNPYLHMHHSWDTAIGVVAIAYQDTLRDSMKEFKAAEVAPEIQISGQVTMASPVVNGYGTYSSKVVDLLTGVNMTVTCAKTRKTYSLRNDASYRCTPDATQMHCKVSGTAFEIKNPRASLSNQSITSYVEDMVIVDEEDCGAA